MSHNASDLPSTISSREEVVAYLERSSAAIAKAKQIVIIGGGASGLEFATEIRERYTKEEKTITVVTSSDVLSSSVAKPKRAFMQRLVDGLGRGSIALEANQRVVTPHHSDFGDMPYLEGSRVVQTEGPSGKLNIEADLVLWCASWTLRADMFPTDWLNGMGELEISDTFQLTQNPDVFAFGDVSSLCETKQAITLDQKLPFVANNVLKVAKAIKETGTARGAKGVKKYTLKEHAIMIIPFGTKGGVTQRASYFGTTKVSGDRFTANYKGKDLFTAKFWKELSDVAPPLPN